MPTRPPSDGDRVEVFDLDRWRPADVASVDLYPSKDGGTTAYLVVRPLVAGVVGSTRLAVLLDGSRWRWPTERRTR
jgi:hypothetical protein